MNRFIPAPNLDAIVQNAAEPELVKVAAKGAQLAAEHVNTDTGYYAENVAVSVDDRGVVFQNNDFAGHIIEWGSIDTEPQAPMRTAAADLGKFEPK